MFVLGFLLALSTISARKVSGIGQPCSDHRVNAQFSLGVLKSAVDGIVSSPNNGADRTTPHALPVKKTHGVNVGVLVPPSGHRVFIIFIFVCSGPTHLYPLLISSRKFSSISTHYYCLPLHPCILTCPHPSSAGTNCDHIVFVFGLRPVPPFLHGEDVSSVRGSLIYMR